MRSALLQKARSAFGRLSPRQGQYATLFVITAVGVGLLWAVMLLTDSKPRAPGGRAPNGASDATVTNIGVMAPGQQVDPLDQWVGTAGRKLATFEHERAEQKRINDERKSFEEKTLARFAELEKRLLASQTQAQNDAARAAAMAAQATQQAASSPPPTRFPPASAMRPAGLPPPPPPLAAHAAPPGGPAIGTLANVQETPPAGLVRVTLSGPAITEEKNPGGAPDGKGPRSGAGQTGESFLPVSFTRGVLLGGLDAPTGGQSQSNPHPVLIRLSDNSILPNRQRAEYRECFVIAAGYGDISSERAYLRTESLSCIRQDGKALEVRIQGSVYGEDGKVGMRGRLVTKQGQMLANALMAGVVSGIGQGFASSNTTYSTSPLGSIATPSGGDAFKTGLGSGVGRALDRLAQYYIKLAEQTFPVVEIDAGREIDVVITKGVRIDTVETAQASPTQAPAEGRGSERFSKAANDDHY